MVGPPIDLVTVFLCYAIIQVLSFSEVGLPSGGVGLNSRAHGAAGPVYAHYEEMDRQAAGLERDLCPTGRLLRGQNSRIAETGPHVKGKCTAAQAAALDMHSVSC